MALDTPQRKKSFAIAASLLLGGFSLAPTLNAGALHGLIAGFCIGMGITIVIYQFGNKPANEVE